MGGIMFIGIGGLIIIGILYWMLWSKLCDIESKLFRMHDETSIELSHIKDQLDTIEDSIERLELSIPESSREKNPESFFDYIDQIEREKKAP